MSRVVAIIPSAGRGLRMGSEIQKPYIRIDGRPILAYTLDVFEACSEVDGIIVVVEPDKVAECRSQVVEPFGYTRVVDVAPGGQTRQQSVFNGLQTLGPDVDIVVVHDAARPCVSAETIRASIRQCRISGAALVAVPVKDTIKVVRNQVVEATPDRSALWLAQTPQTFSHAILKEAHERALHDGYAGTDDTSLVERLGCPVTVIPGDYENIKITTPEDLDTAERILRRRAASAGRWSSKVMEAPPDMRMGFGYDVHAFSDDRACILGGVSIPHERGLSGHSDADVLSHAIGDALLGAAALGDLGRHFPDTDERYRGVSSLYLLEEIRRLVNRAGYGISNIDTTVVAQRPKLAPFVAEMTAKIGMALAIPPGQVSVKATTSEGLGFTGREEGIAAYAVATIHLQGHMP